MIGECVCPKCGMKTSCPIGIDCSQMKCPKCGASMLNYTLEDEINVDEELNEHETDDHIGLGETLYPDNENDFNNASMNSNITLDDELNEHIDGDHINVEETLYPDNEDELRNKEFDDEDLDHDNINWNFHY